MIVTLLTIVLLVESIQKLASDWKTYKERKELMTPNFNLEIHVVARSKVDQLAQFIVDYAAKNEFTARNIMESVDVALTHMKNNAVLTKED